MEEDSLKVLLTQDFLTAASLLRTPLPRHQEMPHSAETTFADFASAGLREVER